MCVHVVMREHSSLWRMRSGRCCQDIMGVQTPVVKVLESMKKDLTQKQMKLEKREKTLEERVKGCAGTLEF